MGRAALAVLLTVVAAAAEARSYAVRPPADDPPALWLRQNAIALASTEPSADDSDLLPLLPLVRNAKVIALGDATHGTHEFFSLKQRLIPLLAARANVRTIVFEAPYGEFEKIRDYVRGGPGDPATLLESSDYYFWDTEEVLDVIRWVRAWNAAGGAPIDIAGADAFHPQTSAARVLAYLRHVDPVAAADAARDYACLTTYAVAPLAYSVAPPDYREACRASVLAVRPRLEAHRAAYAQRSGETELMGALRAARITEQGEEVLATRMKSRDAAIAENIASFAESTRGSVVVWGHNEHFGKTPYTLYSEEGDVSAGTILHERYGARYVAIATVALRGAFNTAAFSETGGTIAPFAMAEPAADDYASFFSTAGLPRMIVPLRGPIPTWLAMPHPIRIGGSNTASREKTTVEMVEDLARRFDAVIYIENSTPTRLRHYPRL